MKRGVRVGWEAGRRGRGGGADDGREEVRSIMLNLEWMWIFFFLLLKGGGVVLEMQEIP